MKTEKEIRAMLLSVRQNIYEEHSAGTLDGWTGQADALEWVLGD